MNSNPNSVQQDASSSFNNSNQNPSTTFQGPPFVPGSMQNLPISGFSNPHLPQQPQQAQQLQQRSLSSNSLLQQNHLPSSQSNQALQQQMIQQLLHMSNNSSGSVQQQPISGQNVNGNGTRNGLSFGVILQRLLPPVPMFLEVELDLLQVGATASKLLHQTAILLQLVATMDSTREHLICLRICIYKRTWSRIYLMSSLKTGFLTMTLTIQWVMVGKHD